VHDNQITASRLFSRWRFWKILVVVFAIDFTLVLLFSLYVKLPMIGFVFVLGGTLLGPFCFLLMFPLGPLSAAFMMTTSLMLLAYAIRPSATMYSLSLAGALVWAFSGFFIMLAGQ
jgi:hypothetical protein